MTAPADPVLHAITTAAVHATAAATGWLLADRGTAGLVVVATTGDADTDVGTIVPPESGVSGFVIASGQPMSITPSSADRELDHDLATLAGVAPRSLLCVPCANDDDVLGVLALIDKRTGGSFSIDDVELATLLGGVAGVALGHHGDRTPAEDPAILSAGLDSLARTDPDRFHAVAALVQALLAS